MNDVALIFGRTPAEVRQLIIMMGDDEIVRLMLFVELGVCRYVEELDRERESDEQRRRRATAAALDDALRAVLDGGTYDDARAAIIRAAQALGPGRG